jgi:two-component system chemotaxis sensor kinase CheA
VEARELLQGLAEGGLSAERGEGGVELVKRLLRLAHTLKGAARVVKLLDISELAHAMEDVLGPSRESGVVPPEAALTLLAQIDQARARLAALDGMDAAPSARVEVPSPPLSTAAPDRAPPLRRAISKPVEPRGPSASAIETVRVDLLEADRLLGQLVEARVRLTRVRDGAGRIERLRDLALAGTRALGRMRQGTSGSAASPSELAKLGATLEELLQVATEIGETTSTGLFEVKQALGTAHDLAAGMRLVSVRTLFPDLRRATYDAARELGRQVRFEGVGGSVRLDEPVLGPLREALLHAVRNAVSHGIEPPEERTLRGKPAEGQVVVTVELVGDHVRVCCRDDGRGVDLGSIRSALARHGVLPEGPELDENELLDCLLGAGVSTRLDVDAVAGRGVGLDVVREVARRLRGRATLRNTADGAELRIQAPVSLASLQVVGVTVGSVAAWVPVEAARGALRGQESEIDGSLGYASVPFGDRLVPLVPLATVLGLDVAPVSPWSALVVEGAEGLVAWRVDRLTGVQRIVARGLPEFMVAHRVVTAAALSATGEPTLVLDPRGSDAHRDSTPREAPAAPRRQRVLVVDDSLTTRMLEQSILESAGYEVEGACSGEEGLEKALQGTFALAVVDIEMPGMNGFELVEAVRRDPTLRTLPIVMVSSRNAQSDFDRAKGAGANGYIVKGEFDQQRLLTVIASLAGESAVP